MTILSTLMKNNKLKLAAIVLLLTLAFSFLGLKSAQASIIDEVKNLLSKTVSSKNLSLESSVALAPGGDLDKNGEINSGDIIRFTYVIANQTNNKYSLATLKTNIDRKSINFIHNIIGTSGIIDNGKTITIPNLRVKPSSSLIISFDARVNYFDEASKTLSTEGELVSSDKKSLLKSAKKQINTKRTKSQESKMLNSKERN